MAYDPNYPTESLHMETGLVEDIDEIRHLGLKLAEYLHVFVHLPMQPIAFDYGSFIDLCYSIVSIESMLEFTTQANFNRNLGGMMGRSPAQIEQIIVDMGLSETLPATHPNAPTPQPLALDPNDPVVQNSAVLRSVLKWQQDNGVQYAEPVEPMEEHENDIPHVSLPAGMDAFLTSLEAQSQEGD